MSKRKYPTIHKLDELLQQNQTEQRTTEWYEEMKTIISASEVCQLFSTPYQRGKFVTSKVNPTRYNMSTTAFSEKMTAFDWGIRFEPVIKQIYSHKYSAIIKELGRLRHPTNHQCSASPDGLIYDSVVTEKIGRLIEIKCPVTRQINGNIPKDYYTQMQLQLHVTGLYECDYVEAEISSIYNQHVLKEGPGLYYGTIALIRHSPEKYHETKQEFYYEYGPLFSTNWIPEEKDIIEMIPWTLIQWHEKVVVRDDNWWITLQPLLEEFWKDVEKERNGLFEKPISKRPKKQKIESCKIVFNRID